jgi:hypothetical protein
MTTTPRLAVLIAIVAALCLAPAASAKQVTASSGGVSATLNYSSSSDGSTHSFGALTVTRDGRQLFDGVPAAGPCREIECQPTVGFDTIPPLRVSDLDADGEPEVLVSAFTGGAHCCFVAQILALKADAGGYDIGARDFGNGGFELKDLDGDGQPEFVATDESFAYAFTAYAFSGRPIVISHYDHGTFVDVTKAYPRLVRRDARSYWRGYLSLRRNKDGSARGQIAPWAADQYRLGKRAYARAVLKREARRGYLGKPAGAAKFIKKLDRFLRRGGY